MALYGKFFHSRTALAIAFLAVGVGLGYTIPRAAQSAGESTVTRQGGYNFINPLLSCDIDEDTPNPQFGALQKQFAQLIDQAKERGDVTRASIYFRDMDTAAWTGVDQNDLYIPASLFKVPILIAYLNDSRTNPNLLSKKYTLPLSPDDNAAEYFKPAHPLQLGGTYTINDLLHAMIEQSDNNAMNVLNRHISTSSIDDVYQSFGVPYAPDNTTASISPAEYMRFFRILYNATYLGRTRSETALEMLSSIDFPEGAVRGLPSNIVFANKFGERTVDSEDATGKVIAQVKDLADCGIVYYPGHPYGICIMTEGNDFSKQADLIAQLSRVAYLSVEAGILNRN